MIARTFSSTLFKAAMPRAAPAVARTSILPVITRSIVPAATRNFSVTPFVAVKGEYDAELSARLAQELSYEQENSNLFVGDSPTAEPGFVTEFKQSGIWKLTDVPGQDEVSLEREFGNEHIKLLFSVGDIDTTGPLPDENDDVEPSPAPEQPENPPFPHPYFSDHHKALRGAIMMDAFVQDGEINIDNIAYYKDKEMAVRMDADADFQRRGFYLGPQFETLDEAVQGQWHQFWMERGLDANMALFIPNYAEYKEQREYCSWLANVRDWIDA